MVWHLQCLWVVCFCCSGPWATLKSGSPYLQGSPFHCWQGSGHVIWTTVDYSIQSAGDLWSACKLLQDLWLHRASLSSTPCKALHISGICRSSQKSPPRKCFTSGGLLLCSRYVMMSRFCISWGGRAEFFNLSVIPSCLMSPRLSLSISLIDALCNSVR